MHSKDSAMISNVNKGNHSRKTLGVSLLLAVIWACVFPPLLRASQNIDEVKAAFVLNFLRFTVWHDASNKKQIVVGHLEKSDLSRLSSLNGRKAQNKKVQVLVSWGSFQESFLDDCDVVYVSEDAQIDVPIFLARLKLKGRPILTIGDGSDFVRNGGMIGIILENNRLTFEINQAAASKVGIAFSSQLLNLARKVLW